MSNPSEIDRILEDITNDSISAIHHSLRATRRRLVVVLVAQQTLPETIPLDIDDHPPNTAQTKEQQFTVRELAREIVALEENVPKEHASGEPYRNVYNSLVQSHLPRLDEISAVKFDADRKTVQPGRNLVALAALAAVTSPLAQKLFQATIASLYAGGTVFPEDSISD